MTTGEKLTMLRMRDGLSQQEFVAAINHKFGKALPYPLTRDMYAKHETDVHEFNWSTAKAFCRYYKISLDELIFEDRKVEKLLEKKRKTAI